MIDLASHAQRLRERLKAEGLLTALTPRGDTHADALAEKALRAAVQEALSEQQKLHDRRIEILEAWFKDLRMHGLAICSCAEPENSPCLFCRDLARLLAAIRSSSGSNK